MSTPEPFQIFRAHGNPLPIVLSSPHSGTEIPTGLTPQLRKNQNLEDTDWFVDQLYDFAPEMGITLIKASYSRYVIDLNRHPQGMALYARGNTDLVPLRTFSGKDLYDKEPSQSEIENRLSRYYLPYYGAIEQELNSLKNQFKDVLLWDCHSIKRRVESIQSQDFPSLILGSNDGRSSHQNLQNISLKNLSSSFDCTHNTPFKGGQITRHFGRPEEGIHALQLEMSQDIYMDGPRYDPSRSEKIRNVLQQNFLELTEALK